MKTHGGRIWCESAIGQGTLFHFTLPKLQTSQVSKTCEV